MENIPLEFKKFIQAYQNKVANMNESFNNNIESVIKEKAVAYDLACVAYETSKTELEKAKAKEQLLVTKKELKKAKKSLHKASEHFIDELLMLSPETYFLTFLHTKASKIPKPKTPLEQARQLDMATAFTDFAKLNAYYLNSSWKYAEFRFVLQATLIDLGKCLERINRYDAKPVSRIATSYNCKSNNDRSQVMAIKEDQLRLQRYHHGEKYCDFARHAIGGAWAQSPVIDTDGGGPKFIDGHPDQPFAKAQYATSSWATHKKGLQTFPIPTELNLVIKQPDTTLPVEFETSLNNFCELLNKFEDKISAPILELVTQNSKTLLSGTLVQKAEICYEIIKAYFLHIHEAKTDVTEVKLVNNALVTLLNTHISPVSRTPSNEHKNSKFSSLSLNSLEKDLVLTVQNYKGLSDAMKIGRGLKWNSKQTTTILEYYQDYCNNPHTASEALDILIKLDKSISAWLDTKHGKSRTQDKRVPTLRALQAFVQDQIEFKKLEINSPKKIHMDVIEAFKRNDNAQVLKLLSSPSSVIPAASIKILRG